MLEYTLQTQLDKLLDRAAELKVAKESDELDLEFVQTELGFISARASELATAACDIDIALQKL